VISNMMASIPAYNEYAQNVLMPQMDQTALAEIKRLEAEGDFENPRYMDLLIGHHYVYHVLRMPPDQWPDPVSRAFNHLNPSIYVPMQGPSELGASGKLLHRNRTADLGRITVPTLVIGAAYDTMDPKHMEWMASALPQGRYLYCPNGSHLAMYDDQTVYMEGPVRFIRDVAAGRSGAEAAHTAVRHRIRSERHAVKAQRQSEFVILSDRERSSLWMPAVHAARS
jgi:proline iminopeptidase